MGKVIIYGLMGLVTIGLLFGFGVMVKMLILMFRGKKEKREQLAQGEDRYCHCGSPDTCPQYGPYRLHKHN